MTGTNYLLAFPFLIHKFFLRFSFKNKTLNLVVLNVYLEWHHGSKRSSFIRDSKHTTKGPTLNRKLGSAATMLYLRWRLTPRLWICQGQIPQQLKHQLTPLDQIFFIRSAPDSRTTFIISIFLWQAKFNSLCSAEAFITLITRSHGILKDVNSLNTLSKVLSISCVIVIM